MKLKLEKKAKSENPDQTKAPDAKDKKKSSQKSYPTKTSINFINMDKEEKDHKKSAMMIGVTAIILALLIVVGIIMPYMQLATKEEKLRGIESMVALLEQDLKQYPKVLDEYNTYTTAWMNDEEKALFDRQAVVDLVEAELMGKASIERYNISENVLLVNLADITLNTTSELVRKIEAREDVSNVQVITANKGIDKNVSTKVTLSIMLIGPELEVEKTEETPEGGAK